MASEIYWPDQIIWYKAFIAYLEKIDEDKADALPKVLVVAVLGANESHQMNYEACAYHCGTSIERFRDDVEWLKRCIAKDGFMVPSDMYFAQDSNIANYLPTWVDPRPNLWFNATIDWAALFETIETFYPELFPMMANAMMTSEGEDVLNLERVRSMWTITIEDEDGNITDILDTNEDVACYFQAILRAFLRDGIITLGDPYQSIDETRVGRLYAPEAYQAATESTGGTAGVNEMLPDETYASLRPSLSPSRRPDLLPPQLYTPPRPAPCYEQIQLNPISSFSELSLLVGLMP